MPGCGRQRRATFVGHKKRRLSWWARGFLGFLVLPLVVLSFVKISIAESEWWDFMNLIEAQLLPRSPVKGNQHFVRVSFAMNELMANAWLTSSTRREYSVQLTVEHVARNSLSNPNEPFASTANDTIPRQSSTVSATLYGKSSLLLKHTKRRSLHIHSTTPFEFLTPGKTDVFEHFGTGGSIALNDFLLLSLWEDEYRISYRTAVDLLRQLDLIFSYAQLVELRCYPSSKTSNPSHPCAPLAGEPSPLVDGVGEGRILGVYLLIEPPSQAMWRRLSNAFDAFDVEAARGPENVSSSASPHVSVSLRRRNYESEAEYDARMKRWRYMWRETRRIHGGNVKSGIELASRYTRGLSEPRHALSHVPSYKSNSSFMSAYRLLERDPLCCDFLDLPQYMAWLAMNTILQNGDYDDEVLFFGMMPTYDHSPEKAGMPVSLGIMGWDYDTIFAPCHRKVWFKTPFMYCAESLFDNRISKVPLLLKRYTEILQILLHHVDVRRFLSSVNVANRELRTIFQEVPAAIQATFGSNKREHLLGRKWIVNQFVMQRELVIYALESQSARYNLSIKRFNDETTAGKAPDGVPPTKYSTEMNLKLLHYLSTLIRVKDARVTTRLVANAENLKIKEVQSAFGHPVAEAGRYTLVNAGMYCARVQVPVSLLLSEESIKMFANLLQQRESRGFILMDVPVVQPCASRGDAEYGLQCFKKLHPMQQPIAPLSSDDGDVTTTLLVVVPPVWPRSVEMTPRGVFVARILRSKQSTANKSSSFTWSRTNTPLSTADAAQLTTLIVRGLSAVRFEEMPEMTTDPSSLSKRYEEENMANGPLLFVHFNRSSTELLVPGTSIRQMAPLASVAPPPPHPWKLPGAAKREIPKGLVDAGGVSFGVVLGEGKTLRCSPEDAVDTTLYTAKCPIFIHDAFTISRGATLEVTAGCVVVLLPAAVLHVKGALQLRGSATQPVVVTSEDAHSSSYWRTIHVDGEASTLHAKFTFFTHSGMKGVRVPGTGKHHSHSAAISATNEAFVSIHHCFMLELRGAAIAAGLRAVVKVADSLVQWAQMGVECHLCSFTSERSVWTNFPSWDGNYDDDDNDAMYLSGGQHSVTDTVIAHTKDDGIDSGGSVGSLVVYNSIIEGCMHEGVALSSAEKIYRDVVISHTVIQYCQQGVECGYTSLMHMATVTSSLIRHCAVGVRFGDNYRWSHCDGTLIVHNTTLVHNELNAMNYERRWAAPKDPRHFHSQSDLPQRHRHLLERIGNSSSLLLWIPASGGSVNLYTDMREKMMLKEGWKGCTNIFSLPGHNGVDTATATGKLSLSVDAVEEKGYVSDLMVEI